MTLLTTEEVRRKLRVACEEAGSQFSWAVSHDITPSYVSNVLRGAQEPGYTLCVALGVRRVMLYEDVEG